MLLAELTVRKVTVI